MRFFSRYHLGLVLLVTASTSWAFGALGHRLAGTIAEDLLTPSARQAVLAVLPEGLGVESTYMDRQRPLLNRLHPNSASWHFIDLPICGALDRSNIMRYCPQGNCLPVQYEKMLKELEQKNLPLEEQQFAMRVLIHLIQDATQPLHTGSNNDRGGNGVRIEGLGRTNLHGAYDTYFMRRNIRGMSETEYVAHIIKKYRPQEKQLVKGSMKDWVLESHDYSASFVYPQLPGFQCGQPFTQTRFTETYTQRAQEIVERQLAAAGFRLAFVLNHIFDHPVPKQESSVLPAKTK